MNIIDKIKSLHPFLATAVLAILVLVTFVAYEWEYINLFQIPMFVFFIIIVGLNHREFNEIFVGQDKTKISRFSTLVIVVALELLSLWAIWQFSPKIESTFLLKIICLIRDNVPLQVLLLGLPPAIVLWIYRTIDTTENLNTNNFSNLSDATNLLQNIENVHSIETGTTLLIEFSKKTGFFNESIKDVFMSLLRSEVPLEQYSNENQNFFRYRSQYTRRYALRVINWLYEGGHIKKGSIPISCLSNQEINLDTTNYPDLAKDVIETISRKILEHNKILEYEKNKSGFFEIASCDKQEPIRENEYIFFLTFELWKGRIALRYTPDKSMRFDPHASEGYYSFVPSCNEVLNKVGLHLEGSEEATDKVD